MEKRQKICFFSILEYSNCKWVGGGGLRQKVFGRRKSHLLSSCLNSRRGMQGECKVSIFLIASTEIIFWVQEDGFKIFLCDHRNGKVLLRSSDFLRAAKKNVPWKWSVGAVWNPWSQADLFFGERSEEESVAFLSSI